MADFYALKLGNGNWLDTGGAQDPVNKVVTDVQNSRVYNSIRSAKMQQTEFIKNRNRFPDTEAFQQKCEVMKLAVTDVDVAVTDNFGSGNETPSVAKKYDPNIEDQPKQQPKQKQKQQKPKQRKPKQKQRSPQQQPKKQKGDSLPSLADLMKRRR